MSRTHVTCALVYTTNYSIHYWSQDSVLAKFYKLLLALITDLFMGKHHEYNMPMAWCICRCGYDPLSYSGKVTVVLVN